MAFDIYGEDLKRGHCEVHPWIGEEYPCSLCYANDEKSKREKTEYNKAMSEMYEEEMKRQEKEYYESIARKNPLYRLLNWLIESIIVLKNRIYYHSIKNIYR